MFEIVIETQNGPAIVEVDWQTWRTYDGWRLLSGQIYMGPVYEATVDEQREAA